MTAAAKAAAQAALQEEIQRINLAKTKTVSVDKIADTDERPFEKMEISPEEQKEYDISSYQAEQKIMEEAAEKGLPPPTFVFNVIVPFVAASGASKNHKFNEEVEYWLNKLPKVHNFENSTINFNFN